jgi:hypothetical protein
MAESDGSTNKVNDISNNTLPVQGLIFLEAGGLT